MPVRKERPILKGIKHGRSCYVKGCGCDVGRKAEAEYQAQRRRERGRDNNGNVISMNGKKTESRDSVKRPRSSKEMGDMEKAVIEECAQLRSEDITVRPTVEIAARNLAKVVDDPDLQGMHIQATKQVMAMMESLRPKEDSAAKKRKSGGRLATVGALTKVKRRGA